MRHTPFSLLETLQVLDLADQVRDGSLTREQLVINAQSLDTEHTRQEIELAVDAHLAKSGLEMVSSYNFGWDRPNSTAALEKARNRYCRGPFRILGWFAHPNAGFLRFFAWLAMFQTAWLAMACSFNLEPQFTILGLFAATVVGAISADVILAPREAHMRQFLTHRLGDQMIKRALDHPSTRAYLRAVAQSGVPKIMKADAKRIEAILTPPQSTPDHEMSRIKDALIGEHLCS